MGAEGQTTHPRVAARQRDARLPALARSRAGRGAAQDGRGARLIAASALLGPSVKVMKQRGSVIESVYGPCLITVHPSSLLRVEDPRSVRPPSSCSSATCAMASTSSSATPPDRLCSTFVTGQPLAIKSRRRLHLSLESIPAGLGGEPPRGVVVPIPATAWPFHSLSPSCCCS